MPKKLIYNPISGNFDTISEVAVSSVGSSPNSNGASVDANQTLSLQPADGSNPGVITAGTQTIGGNKTLTGSISASNLSGTNSGDVTLANVGSTPNSAGASLSSQQLTLQPADSTNPGVVSTTTQTFSGSKTFTSLLNADGGIDLSTSGTLTIGGTNSSIINIGNSGSTVNIQGTTIYENTPQLLTADPLITVNHGGASGSGQNSGIEVEEGGSITGYAETSSDRNSWILKAPNTAGIATITPGSSGITLDQSSHNPVTLGSVGSSPAAQGASLSGQQLTLQPANGANPGVVSTTTQTFGGTKTFTSAPVLSSLTASLPLKLDNSNVVISAAINLASEVTGVTPIANGGTNSSTTLNNNRIMQSSSGSIVEAATITANRALISDSNGIPTQSSVTNTELGYVSGVTSSIQTQLNDKSSAVPGDISPTSFSASNNQSSAANVTGFNFTNGVTGAFEAIVRVSVSASSSFFEAFYLRGVQRSGSWFLASTSVGDESGFIFSITNLGQIQYTNSNYSGFTSATIKFRATSLPL